VHRLVYLVIAFRHQRTAQRTGIALPPNTTIGPGLFISHFGGIFIHAGATIGKNCNLANDITIGKAHQGVRAGVPTIGDNVFIAPGTRVLGAITIGDDAVIGANAVVTRDVAASSVVAGNPAAVISQSGSAGLVNDRV
jgi:serine O-acetyltransferase